MKKILKYSFYDLIRSKWTFVYCAFFAVLTLAFFILNNDASKVVTSLMNIILSLVPLVAISFGVMYYYNSREFIELLLAQPIRRRDIFLGQYLGVGTSLSLSIIFGMGLPFCIFGLSDGSVLLSFLTLMIVAVVLSFIFSGIGFYISMRNENKIKGFGLAILIWLFFVIIYDGIFLIALSVFSEYPLEKFALGATLFNPIDLSRILITLQLDISVMMGYTGAIFKMFFGSGLGMILVAISILFWLILPALGIRKLAISKDF
jgi:Cu-processing system permease protein